MKFEDRLQNALKTEVSTIDEGKFIGRMHAAQLQLDLKRTRFQSSMITAAFLLIFGWASYSQLNDSIFNTQFVEYYSYEDNYEGDFQTTKEIVWTLTFTMKGYVYPDVKTGSVVKTVIVNLRMPGDSEIPPSEYIILEDSTTLTTNYLLLNADAGSPNATGTMKVLNESSSAAVGAAGIKSRYTVTPGPGDATANDDFGFTETFEYFDDNIDTNVVTGLDVTL